MMRVFVDTNVLFPFSVMDLMLALTEDGIHNILWTDALLEEWERVIVRSGRRSLSSAAAITAAVRKFFPESEVPFGEFADLITGMPGKDPDDRVHMAAAVAGHATHIITYNVSAAPSGPATPRPLLPVALSRDLAVQSTVPAGQDQSERARTEPGAQPVAGERRSYLRPVNNHGVGDAARRRTPSTAANLLVPPDTM